MIPYGRQSINDEDVTAVTEVLAGSWLTQGPKVAEFEQQLAHRCQSQDCAVVSNGTAALHLACLALGLGTGDWLWTSPISFVASANCARYCGASVDFVDVDPNNGNLCPERLAEKLQLAESQGRLPKVVVAVHFGGNPCDLKIIHELLNPLGIKLIEDASHALGADYHGDPIGAGQYSDLTTLSFHPVKIITSGEGGAVLGNDSVLIERIRQLRTHGITKDPALLDTTEEGGWYYEQQALGWNYRITDLQAALGISQLKRVDDFIVRRRQIAQRYDVAMQSLPCQPLSLTTEANSSFHLYVIQVPADQRRSLYDYLQDNAIGVQVHYIPIHTQPYYRQLGFKLGDFPQAEAFYRGCLSLPVFPELTDEDQDKVIGCLQAFFA